MPFIELKGKVRWCDADAAGIMYFPRIFDYYSEAEGELLRSVGIHKKPDEGFGFPRVHAECQFKKVLPLGTAFNLRIEVKEVRRTSICYRFQVFIEGELDRPAADGSVTVVLIRNGRPAEIPPELRAKLSD